MNVAELITWLQTQDQEAIVQVLVHSSGTGYYDQGGNVMVQDFTPDGEWGVYDHYEYTDFRDNQFVKPDAPYYNKRYLQFGTKDN